MINFIKWGLNHDNSVIENVFVVGVILSAFGWIISWAILLMHSHTAWGLTVLITPIAYLIYKMWNIYAKETNK